MKEPQNGDLVKDIVTGFKGVVTSRTEYLNGCVRLAVQPLSHSGKYSESVYLDREQLKVVKRKAVTVELLNTGGDRDNPKRAPDPRR